MLSGFDALKAEERRYNGEGLRKKARDAPRMHSVLTWSDVGEELVGD